MKISKTWVLCGIVALSLACDDSKAPKPSIPPTVKKAEREVDLSPAQEPIAEADVSNLVETWMKTQNSSDFEGYIALYGAKFEGIKRVGAKTYRFDKQGWKADRGRMFQKAFQVQVKQIVISMTAQSAVVRFEQTWTSGSFSDAGPKQLVIYQGDEGLRIGREEMLSSTILGTNTRDGAVDPNQAALLLEGQYILLAADVKPEWLRGNPQADKNALAAKGVHLDKLPPKISQWKGRGVHVYDAMGKPVCNSPVVGIRAIARFNPHFSMVQEWYDANGDPRESDKAIANEAFDLAGSDGVVLVAKLKEPCALGVFARTLPAPNVLVRDEGELSRSLKRSFQELDGVKSIQSAFEASGGTGSWLEAVSDESNVFSRERESYAVVSFRGGAGCGEFYGEFWAIFWLKGDEIKLVTDEKTPGRYFEAVGAVDADGDGRPEFMGTNQVARHVDGLWRVVTDVTPPDFDCGC